MKQEFYVGESTMLSRPQRETEKKNKTKLTNRGKIDMFNPSVKINQKKMLIPIFKHFIEKERLRSKNQCKCQLKIPSRKGIEL